MFETHDFNMFPVVDEARGIVGVVSKERRGRAGVLVGVVSRSDVLRCLMLEDDGSD